MTDPCPSGWQREDLFIQHESDCAIPSAVVLGVSWALFAGGLLCSIVNGLVMTRLLVSGEWQSVRRADFMAVVVLAIPGRARAYRFSLLTASLLGFSIVGMIGLQWLSFRQAAIPCGAYFFFVASMLVSETPNASLNINACKILFSLEPSAGAHLKELTTRLKPWFLVVGLVLWGSVVGMGFSDGRLVYVFLVSFAIACAAQLALQIVPDVMVYSKSLRTSESIEAYLEEFPGERADLEKLKRMKLIGIVTLGWHIPGFGLLIYFGRYAGLIQACLMASAMPLGIFHGFIWLQRGGGATEAEAEKVDAEAEAEKHGMTDMRTTARTVIAVNKLKASAGIYT